MLVPTVDEMARRGTPFSGLLYAGLALTTRGVRVVEFNARFGDPETQALLPLLDSPLGRSCTAPPRVGSTRCRRRWKPAAAVTVVVAGEGYPESSAKGDVITGVDDADALDGVHVIHAGTAAAGGDLVTAGGRVLAVIGTGSGPG